MHYQETKEYKLLEQAKGMVFEKMPEEIDIFNEMDEAYCIYSELADVIITKIDIEAFLTKTIDLLDHLIRYDESTIETLIVIQIFQKL